MNPRIYSHLHQPIRSQNILQNRIKDLTCLFTVSQETVDQENEANAAAVEQAQG